MDVQIPLRHMGYCFVDSSWRDHVVLEVSLCAGRRLYL